MQSVRSYSMWRLKMKNVAVILLSVLLLSISIGCSRDSDDPSPLDDIVKVPSLESTEEVDSSDNLYIDAHTVRARGISGNGILWKPRSESDGNLVVLLKRSYGRPSIAVYILSGSTYKFSENGRFVYYSNPDRATYRFGKRYKGKCLLRVGGSFFYVPEGGKRYE